MMSVINNEVMAVFRSVVMMCFSALTTVFGHILR